MRAVKRWRYYCEFCPKAGNSGHHMKRHESGCTLNPDRVCKHCAKLGNKTVPMANLLALLPDPAQFVIHHPAEPGEFGYDAYDAPDDEALNSAVGAALPKLRELIDNCPTCILAALRQKGIPVPAIDGFNYSEELKEFWAGYNDSRPESYPY
jgi:hypothetical protein